MNPLGMFLESKFNLVVGIILFVFAFPLISIVMSGFIPFITANSSIPGLVKFLFQLVIIPALFFIGFYLVIRSGGIGGLIGK